MRNIITLDSETMTTVEQVKQVGDGVVLSHCCVEVSEYNTALLGARFDRKQKAFFDEKDNPIAVNVIALGADHAK